MKEEQKEESLAELVGKDFIAAKEKAHAYIQLYAIFNKIGKKAVLQDQLLDEAEKALEPFISKIKVIK